jgi:hypothetical protein
MRNRRAWKLWKDDESQKKEAINNPISGYSGKDRCSCEQVCYKNDAELEECDANFDNSGKKST